MTPRSPLRAKYQLSAKRNLNVNYPTNSNISDVALFDSLANQVYVRPHQIEIYGTELIEASNLVQDNYEYLDEVGRVTDLPLTRTEIIDVLTVRLTSMCEEYLKDIADQSMRDGILKQMIERKVGLKTKQAA